MFRLQNGVSLWKNYEIANQLAKIRKSKGNGAQVTTMMSTVMAIGATMCTTTTLLLYWSKEIVGFFSKGCYVGFL